jgi:hypothetical protein
MLKDTRRKLDFDRVEHMIQKNDHIDQDGWLPEPNKKQDDSVNQKSKKSYSPEYITKLYQDSLI